MFNILVEHPVFTEHYHLAHSSWTMHSSLSTVLYWRRLCCIDQQRVALRLKLNETCVCECVCMCVCGAMRGLCSECEMH